MPSDGESHLAAHGQPPGEECRICYSAPVIDCISRVASSEDTSATLGICRVTCLV